MRIGDVIRYPQHITEKVTVDGLPNWYFETRGPDGAGWNVVRLDAGINQPALIGKVARRAPFIAIRSSPHRFGSAQTPWEDIHRPDQGFCRYFGDAKPGAKAAEEYLGNERMIDAFLLHKGDRADRAKAPPILVFEAVPFANRIKGQVMFHGVGVITRAELVVQRHEKSGQTFPNYMYEIALLDLADENEAISWDWINARRDGHVSDEACLALAPRSWKRWVESGPASVVGLRRNVLARSVVSEKMQRPPTSSPEFKILKEIYSYYHGKKHRFEALAEFTTNQIFEEQQIKYRMGWITQGGGDGGYDFVGSVDLDPGSVLRSSQQVVLGQAKCEKLDKPTNGMHIARLAARLRRGWVGVYKTTSYFSTSVQREVLADRYPVILVDGYRLSLVISTYLKSTGMSLHELLEGLSSSYEGRIGFGDPEAILA